MCIHSRDVVIDQMENCVALSIYYLHYGMEEIRVRRKHMSACRLIKCLHSFGFQSVQEVSQNVRNYNVEIQIYIIICMSHHLYDGSSPYEHKNKNSRQFYARAIGIRFRDVIERQITLDTLRSVYSIIV